jgi:hypothetical protein
MTRQAVTSPPTRNRSNMMVRNSNIRLSSNARATVLGDYYVSL